MLFLLILVIIIVLIIAGIRLFLLLSPEFGGIPDKKVLQDRAKNAVYRDGKFHNAIEVSMLLPHSLPKILKQQFKSGKGRVPHIAIPSVKEPFNAVKKSNDINVRWLGHSTVIIQTNGLNLLIDPVFTRRASPLRFSGPVAFKGAMPYQPEDLPDPDYIILSHDHFDHLDYQSIKCLHNRTGHFLVPLGVEYHLIRWGIDPAKITSFDWWENYSHDNNFSITATPAQHFTGRRKRSNDTLWCSWIIELNGKKLFFNGDSGYSPHFREIGSRCGPFDLTMIECGAYGDYWPYMHMKPEETHQANTDLGGERLMPVHWAKFNLAFHAWNEPVIKLTKISENSGTRIITPIIGESFNFSEEKVFKKWWNEIQ